MCWRSYLLHSSLASQEYKAEQENQRHKHFARVDEEVGMGASMHEWLQRQTEAMTRAAWERVFGREGGSEGRIQ
jgi:hypothetical protein